MGCPAAGMSVKGETMNLPGDFRGGAVAVRSLIVAGAMGVAFLAMPPREAEAGSNNAPWCGQLAGDYGLVCSFYSFEQCRDFVRGVSQLCVRNLNVPEEPPPPPPRKRVRR